MVGTVTRTPIALRGSHAGRAWVHCRRAREIRSACDPSRTRPPRHTEWIDAAQPGPTPKPRARRMPNLMARSRASTGRRRWVGVHGGPGRSSGRKPRARFGEGPQSASGRARARSRQHQAVTPCLPMFEPSSGSSVDSSADPPLLTANTVDRRVELRVVNTGPGVAITDRDRVFVPFQRLRIRGLGCPHEPGPRRRRRAADRQPWPSTCGPAATR
jgi:hypothetical protein